MVGYSKTGPSSAKPPFINNYNVNLCEGTLSIHLLNLLWNQKVSSMVMFFNLVPICVTWAISADIYNFTNFWISKSVHLRYIGKYTFSNLTKYIQCGINNIIQYGKTTYLIGLGCAKWDTQNDRGRWLLEHLWHPIDR